MSNQKKRPRRAKRRGKAPLIVVLVLVAAALIAAALWLWLGGGEEEQPGETGQSETSDTAQAESSALPQVEQSAGLTLSSVYTSSILNPDCGGEYAEEIASLEVTNSSGSYLVSAALTATMSDGTEVFFRVYDLPAGATAEIFDTENRTLDSSVTCTSLVCTSEEYIEEDVLLSNTVEISVSGSDAVITNTGSSALKNLTVVYHCDMAGQFFGGASYTISIDNLAAGESFTLSDSALMGEVAVVRIYQ